MKMGSVSHLNWMAQCPQNAMHINLMLHLLSNVSYLVRVSTPFRFITFQFNVFRCMTLQLLLLLMWAVDFIVTSFHFVGARSKVACTVPITRTTFHTFIPLVQIYLVLDGDLINDYGGDDAGEVFRPYGAKRAEIVQLIWFLLLNELITFELIWDLLFAITHTQTSYNSTTTKWKIAMNALHFS